MYSWEGCSLNKGIWPRGQTVISPSSIPGIYLWPLEGRGKLFLIYGSAHYGQSWLRREAHFISILSFAD